MMMLNRLCLATPCIILTLLAGMRLDAQERIVFAESIRPLPENAAVRDAVAQADLDSEMPIMISLKMRDFAGLQARIAAGEIISQNEMAEKYLPLEADFNALKEWAKSEGLTQTQTSASRLCLFLSGKTSQVQRTLQISLAHVADGESTFISANTAPSLPAEISRSVLGIHGLQPHLRHHKNWVRPSAGVAPRANSLTGFIPSDILKAYGASGLKLDGSGQKIAILIDVFPAKSDLTAFWSATGTPQTLSNIEFVPAVPEPLMGAPGETTLDVEWSSSIAPGAQVRVYGVSVLSQLNLDAGYNAIINDIPTQPAMHQLSLSFGSGELFFPVDQMKSDSQLFATMSAAGITVFSASGDQGSQTDGSLISHRGPFQVVSPGNDPNVTCVGGTSITVLPDGTLGSESAWHDGGGGISTVFDRPAWQMGSAFPSGSKRLCPDLASAADPNTGCMVIQNGSSIVVGGTSWSSPTWAGFCAIINQGRANAGLPPMGLMGPKVYPLLGTLSFNDVTTGNNGPRGMFNAGPGFDLCTGLGTPNMSALVTALGSPSTIQFDSAPIAMPSTVSANQTVTFSTSASSNTIGPFGGPANTVTITWDFGDGSPRSMGATVTHSYTTSGTYTAQAIAFDGASTLSLPATVTVSDVILVNKSSLKFDFKRQNDSFNFSGPITVPPGLKLSGTTISVVIGGYANTFNLGTTGRGGGGGDQVAISGKSSRGMLLTTTPTFTVTLSRQNLFDSFKGFGFTNDTVTAGGPFTLTAKITVNGASYIASPKYVYSAKPGLSGMGKLQP